MHCFWLKQFFICILTGKLQHKNIMVQDLTVNNRLYYKSSPALLLSVSYGIYLIYSLYDGSKMADEISTFVIRSEICKS